METHARSWAKSVTWRVIGIVILGGISYAITRSWAQTTVITVIFHSVRLILYYFHERAWERISWGKLKHPLARFPVKNDLTPENFEVIEKFLKEQKCLIRTDYEI